MSGKVKLDYVNEKLCEDLLKDKEMEKKTGDKRSLTPVNQPEMKKEKIDRSIRSAGIIRIPIGDEEEHAKKITCKPCRKVFTRTDALHQHKTKKDH